jgi:hypothetical protein
MKALTWKAVFASMNPSPLFEAVAMFGEGLALDGADDSALPKRPANERSHAKEADRSSKRSATCCASQTTRIASKRDAQSIRMCG